jgi:multimeric flavodoxin WrbA
LTASVADLTALVLSCTLKQSPAESSATLLGEQFLEALREHGAEGEVVRLVDHHIRFGVSPDEGDGDQWPAIRDKMLAADLLVLATPIWLGQPSSVAKMALERLDAELSATDDQGRMSTYDKVAAVAVVGNEDGAHHVCAELFQALNDVGFTLAAGAGTYWVGEAMQSRDYKDLAETPEMVAKTTATLARNAAHPAAFLKANEYPGG